MSVLNVNLSCVTIVLRFRGEKVSEGILKGVACGSTSGPCGHGRRGQQGEDGGGRVEDQGQRAQKVPVEQSITVHTPVSDLSDDDMSDNNL
ncbi:hypothetical protein F441_01748 [Phytophthora nicotianae CJ01A1]|uniref:Uncharacterized protein n=1 Tax=Phytophthora nicotianae CJ01A1 TaxID=1317063 RepID=W2XRP7_PHYNI|nr:hypothetical protein F441_01748 [Phytophthora nicotianae CJ01A1]